MKQQKYRNKIMNRVPAKEKLETNIRACFEKLETMDQDHKMQASLNGDGYFTYILKPVRGIRRGTKMEIDNLLVHVRKGCYKMPLPIEKMNLRINQTNEFSDLLQIQCTSQGEVFN